MFDKDDVLTTVMNKMNNCKNTTEIKGSKNRRGRCVPQFQYSVYTV